MKPPELGQNVPVRVTQAEGDRPIVVVLDGGPLDGTPFTEIEGDELDIVMSEGQQHRYVRTGSAQRPPDGPLAQVFAWRPATTGLREQTMTREPSILRLVDLGAPSRK